MNAALLVLVTLAAPTYNWPHTSARPLTDITPPPGFKRAPAAPGSFAEWLRGLPLRPEGTPVRIYDGALKGNQSAQHAVIDMDVGQKDHQQCADAVMRLRAEYLFSVGRSGEVSFKATNGSAMPWALWKAGQRPHVGGKRIDWKSGAAADDSWKSFRRYLDSVFVYAGSWSLERQLRPVATLESVQPGDVIIKGGFPGHAVIVVDVVENAAGERMFLLAQSYMPAQDVHVLRNPASPTPWYPAKSASFLQTPEWLFSPLRLMRFE
jgi:hypothetical protein